MKLLKLTALLLVLSGSVALCSDKEKVETPNERVMKKLDDFIWLLEDKNGIKFSCGGGEPSTYEHGLKLVEIQKLCATWVNKIHGSNQQEILQQQADLKRLVSLQAQLLVPKEDGKERKASN